MSHTRPLLFAIALLQIGVPGLLRAASPPELLNYQGVLRDANGLPLSGDYSMVFRLETADTGDEILVDDHSGGAAGTGVPVVDGLFNVRVGSGAVSDGGGPGFYVSLAEVFRDYSDVVLSVEVEGERLTPTIPIASTPFALNAKHFDGLDSGKFLRTDVSGVATGNLWFSASPTGPGINAATLLVKPVSAALNETILGVGVSTVEKFRVDAEGDAFIGGSLNMPNGGQFWNTPADLQLFAGDEDTDDLILRAGNTSDDGQISILGDSFMELRAASGQFYFRDDSGDGGRIAWNDFGVGIVAGEDATDDIVLYAGNAGGNGAMTIEGNGSITLDSWTGHYMFDSPNGGAAVLESPGILQVVSDGSVHTFFDRDDAGSDEVQWWSYLTILGTYGPAQRAELQESGDFRIGGQYESNASFDLAESFLAVGSVEPGDVVAVDASRPDAVRLAAGVAETAVIGVVSTKPGVVLGSAPFDARDVREVWGDAVYQDYLKQESALHDVVLASTPALRERLDEARREPDSDQARRLEHDLEGEALERFFERRFARVALAGRVPVKVDAGFGEIRVGDLLTTSPTPGHAMRADDPQPGTVIGKALEGLDAGTGRILVLVTLR